MPNWWIAPGPPTWTSKTRMSPSIPFVSPSESPTCRWLTIVAGALALSIVSVGLGARDLRIVLSPDPTIDRSPPVVVN